MAKPAAAGAKSGAAASMSAAGPPQGARPLGGRRAAPIGGATSAADALVVFTPSGRRGRVPIGTPLLQAARSLGVDIDSVCGGRGLCGRCQVLLAEGNFAKHGVTSRAGKPVAVRRRRARILPPPADGGRTPAVVLGARSSAIS